MKKKKINELNLDGVKQLSDKVNIRQYFLKIFT